VDEVKPTSSTPASAVLLRNLSGLRDFIVRDLNTLTGGQASILICKDRFPSDPGDFDDREVNSLDNLRVLLEVWGAIQDPATGQGVLGFVLVPARPLSPPAVFMVRRSAPNFLTQAKRGLELRAFAPLALGIRAYQNKLYEESVPNLCQGAHELDGMLKMSGATMDAALRSAEEKLLITTRTTASDAIKQARTDPHSRYGILRPQADGTFVCPTAGGS
jgi:hypothetical protein